MDTDKIIEEKKKIQTSLLDFLENETDKELHFQNLTKLLNENKNKRKEVYEFKEILYLINKIANNHHRLPNFNSEIIQIIDFLKQDIKENFVNSEILNIFQDNKLILLFLITNEILTINSNIADKMSDYFHFFYPELSTFNEEIKYDPPENFESLRSAGENDSYICNLIRNDSIDDFVKYITQTNFGLSSQIPPSYFETNPFLLKHSKETTLIEYSAFCGATQIFNFLKNQRVELKPSLWLYAIHSNNYELIHLLEEFGVVPDDKTHKRCLREALKCFHNEIANYIKDRLLDEKVKEGLGEKKFRDNLIDYCFHYYNLTFLPEKFDHSFNLYYYCLYNYFSLFKLLDDKKGAQILKERIIQKMIVFFLSNFETN